MVLVGGCLVSYGGGGRRAVEGYWAAVLGRARDSAGRFSPGGERNVQPNRSAPLGLAKQYLRASRRFRAHEGRVGSGDYAGIVRSFGTLLFLDLHRTTSIPRVTTTMAHDA